MPAANPSLHRHDKSLVVRGAGLEPAQCCHRQDLNLVRLPISPPALQKKGKNCLNTAPPPN